MAWIEVRGFVKESIQVGYTVVRLAHKKLGRGESEFIEPAGIGFTKGGEPFAFDRIQHGCGRDLGRLVGRDEVRVIGREPDAMIHRLTREARLFLAVESYAVQLCVERMIVTVGHVVHDAGIFINVEDFSGGVIAAGQTANQASGEVTKLVLEPTGLLGLPDESLSVIEELDVGTVSLPRALGFGDDDATRARLNVGGDEFQDVLVPVGSVEQLLRSVG